MDIRRIHRKNPTAVVREMGYSIYCTGRSHIASPESIVGKKFGGTESICKLPHWECIDEKYNMYRKKGENV